MNDGAAFVAPEIKDAAIPWVCGVLGLPDTAFSGSDGLDSRLSVLKSLATMDIEACPGSGKTTLLVAKLAILGSLWAEPTRGLCVLSHTNVARREIERSLGNTMEGQRLLSYPHFIGTIHGFANEFLAIPWLRSKGHSVKMIDDEVAQLRRWRKLSPEIRSGLEQNRHDQGIMKIRDADFGFDEIRWGKGGTLRKETSTYKALVNACRESTLEGYFCHDEMFVWAHDLMDKMPEVIGFLRARFPLLFVDEVQDNSELQSKLLHRVFMEGDGSVMRQRYGDANQAIYQYAGQTRGATTDPFPVPGIRTDIPNSFRFGQEIADLTNSLALQPQGLQGRRQSRGVEAESDTSGKHAIFLFDDASIGKILETYAAYLLEVFSEKERQNGTFTAVGAVHRPSGDDKVPRNIGHYWPVYDHGIASADPQPETFIQYVAAGHRLSEVSGETYAMVEKIAEAILRLMGIADPKLNIGRAKRKHRHVLELLDGKDIAKMAYMDLVHSLGVERMPLNENGWNAIWRPAIKQIVQEITGAALDHKDTEAFLAWEHAPTGVGDQEQRERPDNIFRYPHNNPTVAVRVGSIHSVKGQTHTATLVLETFYRAHHLKTLKPWLLGDRAGSASANDILQSRLKLHYVAMTRPSRLLCLAMREDALNDNEIAKLMGRGWRVARVKVKGLEWIADGF